MAGRAVLVGGPSAASADVAPARTDTVPSSAATRTEPTRRIALPRHSMVAEVNLLLREPLAGEHQQTRTAPAPEVAGQVDPLLAVPVGDEGVQGQHVVVEELRGGRPGRQGGQ